MTLNSLAKNPSILEKSGGPLAKKGEKAWAINTPNLSESDGSPIEFLTSSFTD